MHRQQLESDQRVFQAGDAASGEVIAQPIPAFVDGRVDLAKIEEDVTLICVKANGDAMIGNLVGAAQVFEPRE